MSRTQWWRMIQLVQARTASYEWHLDDFKPSVVRRTVGNLLSLWGASAESIDDAKLITSEVVTNAVKHVHPELRKGYLIHIRISMSRDTLRFEISDPDPRPPQLIRAGHDDERHRGLAIVDALAKDWGSKAASSGIGKVVWWTQTVSFHRN